VSRKNASTRGRPRRARDAAAARTHRIAFERLVADLAVRIANVSHDGIVTEIEAALRRLVDSLGYDRCTYTEFGSDGTFNVVCSAAVGGVEPLPRGLFGPRLPWLVGEIRAGRTVALANLPDDLPPEATAEAERWPRIGLRSHLSIPLRAGGRVVGALSLGSFRGAQAWPEQVITRLTIIGEVFASAIARARSEEEAQQLRTRLWHADRVARPGARTAAIAHELNQPLAAILSNAQAGLAYLGRGEAVPDEVRAILEAIVRDDKRAAETIRTMRALLRQDATGRARIDVAAAVREVLQLLAAELYRRGIRVETELETGCWALADKVQLEQVVMNLILNAATALQARPRGERLLRLSGSRADDGRIVVAVRDSGPGIAAEHLETVFAPFWTTRREGLGLGLAICRSIVQAHGGAILAEPNPDRGISFRFELPGEAGEGDRQAAGAPALAAEVAARAPGGAPLVCVVDDDAAVREAVARLLAAMGWRVASYPSAGEFLARGALADVACVLLDHRMPGLSGLELLEQLAGRADAPPVVFVTGQADVATGVDAMKLGAVDFLVKPVEREVLVAAVRKALERHAGERERTLERDACRALVARLSARERDVLEQVIRGRLNKQIAADLDIAEQTVKQHRGRVMEKMEVRSVAGLVRVCGASGLFAGSAHAPGRGDPAAPLRGK
jgi:FixJ family two-component response regulator/signal transduction histidine kinase